MLKSFLVKHKELLLVTFLVLSLGFLRFYDLGYSDYISDEPGTFFYRGGKKNPEMTPWEFMLSQRKGPLQLFVGYIPYLLVGNYKNELAQRIPFALFSTSAVVAFYFLVKKLSKSSFVGFVSAFLFGVNGLVVAYGRVAQYESLNMLFSFLALWFYSKLECLLRRTAARPPTVYSSLLGTFFFSLSLLAHWDAVYILIPVSYIFFQFFKGNSLSLGQKIQLLGLNALVFLLVTGWFLTPYFINLQSNASNAAYAENILGFGGTFKNRKDLFYFSLYNPFLTFYLYLVFGVIGIFFSRKNPIFIFWAVAIILAFRFFVKYSGLHFYNIFPPIVILVAYVFYALYKSKLWLVKYSSLTVLFLVLGFLYYQSYLVFVDHKVEYPWDREKIVFWKTPKYTHETEMRHKTGFPHKRYWQEISDFINTQNYLRGETLGYFTNEYKEVAKFYLDIEYVSGGRFYAIGIKRPTSFAIDYKLSQIKNKSTVHVIENEFGEGVTRIYRVEPKE